MGTYCAITTTTVSMLKKDSTEDHVSGKVDGDEAKHLVAYCRLYHLKVSP